MSKPKRHNRTWTPAEVAQLKKESKRLPVTEIKKRHQRTEAAIRSKAQEKKISLKPTD